MAHHENALQKLYGNTPAMPQVSTKMPQPEKLVTQMGATAGSGSGDFHVYRAQRRREMARLENMDKVEAKVAEDTEFYSGVAAKLAAVNQALQKHQSKRAKKKEKVKLAKALHIQAVPFANDGNFMANFLREHAEQNPVSETTPLADQEDESEANREEDSTAKKRKL